MYFFSNRKPLAMLSLFCLTLIFTPVISAQDKEWRPVSPKEAAMKTSIVEPDADAEAIFWETRIDDSSSDELARNHYVRVKIFTERGREKYSKFDIPFSRGIKIKDIAARVIKADGTITEITNKDIFEREIIKAGKVKIKAKSFAIPNIEPGVIVEYRYREVIDGAGATGMELPFQKDIPVQSLTYYYKPYNKKEPSYQSYNFTDTKFVKDEKGYYLAKRENVPAFKEEPRMPPEDMVRPWIKLQSVGYEITGISNFSISFTVKDPSNPNKFWGAVSAENLGLLKYITSPNKEIKKVATEITASATSDEEKLRKLYEYVQAQIKNTSFDTSLSDEDRKKLPKIKELSDILKHKTASGQYIDMLFGAMTSSLGYETRVAFAGNRSKMFFHPEMTVESFVHPAAIAVLVGDKWKYFNPGMAFLPHGMMMWYEEDVWALLVGEKRYSWEKTPMTGIEKSTTKRTGKLKLTEDGTLEGTIREEYAGQPALINRLDIYEDSPTQREENIKAEIKQRISAAEVSDIIIENLTDSAKPLTYQYKIRVPNYAQRTGKRLFLQPGFFEYGVSPLFATASRKYDIYFHYPWSEDDDITILLPKNFALDSADTPPEVADKSNISQLKVSIGIDKTRNLLIYTRKFHFGGGGNTLFNVSAYQPLKTLFDAFHKTDSHIITLKEEAAK
ncbi:MAG: Transglutaminase protein [Acidobacteria bacterium]|nr:Transglutaminase protein [Acidobacteriota bacterium]